MGDSLGDNVSFSVFLHQSISDSELVVKEFVIDKNFCTSFNYLTSPVTPRRRLMLQRGQDTSLQDKDQDRLALGSSSSSSTSYLMSPRPLRSKVSNEGCQSSTDSSRHGWLYTQKSFKFNNRCHKKCENATIL